MGRESWRIGLLAAVSAVAAIAVAAAGPIPQDPAYHAFSDQQEILGIPHFWNVASNVPFALVGLIGLHVLLRTRPEGLLPELTSSYALFFTGAVLIAFGSAAYHLAPDNASLAWDRLPMTISFMAFFAIILGEHGDPKVARRLLGPLVAIGIASVAYWAVSERLGRSDLRPYVIVQFLPLLLVPLILLLFPSRLTMVWLIWVMLAFYGAAKVVELADRPIHLTLGFVSGHTLKHLFAAAAMLIPVIALRVRRRATRPSGVQTAPERR